jgi:hypothetical protein
MEKIDAKITEMQDYIKDLKAALKGEKPKKKEKKKNEDGEEEEEKERVIPDDPDKIKSKIAKLEESIHKWETKKTDKVCFVSSLSCGTNERG